MMLATPIPPTDRVKTPTMAMKRLNPRLMASVREAISIVFQTKMASSSLGSNRNFFPKTSRTSFRSALIPGPEDHVVDVFRTEDRGVSRSRNESRQIVPFPVARVLLFVDEDANDLEGNPVQQEIPALSRSVLEQLVLELAADENGPPFQIEVRVVQETAAHPGDHVAHGRINRIDAADRGQVGVLALLELDAAPGVFRADFRDERDLRFQIGRVLLAEPESPSHAQPLIRQTRLPGPDDHQTLPHAVHVLPHLPPEADPESQEKDDGDGPPGDAEHRQHGPQLLGLHVPEKLGDEHERFHGGYLISLGGLSTISSPSFNPSRTSILIPSLSPVWISFFTIRFLPLDTST